MSIFENRPEQLLFMPIPIRKTLNCSVSASGVFTMLIRVILLNECFVLKRQVEGEPFEKK